MTALNPRLGVLLMALTTVVFALQDGISRHLAGTYNVYMVVMVRYWFFAAFVLAMTLRHKGALTRILRPHHPWLQGLRGVLLVVEIYVTVIAFVKLGLIDAYSVFISYPLIVAALSGPVLGEHVGWRRWCAIGVGFVGVLIILQPGPGVLSSGAMIPLVAALMFALYALLTRYVSDKDDTQTSFFWIGIAGAVTATVVGLPFWQAMSPGDWAWMALLCVFGALAHWLMIRAYELAEASSLQPIAYLQLVWGTAMGMAIFGDVLHLHVAVGAILTTGAGLFTIWRARQAARAKAAQIRAVDTAQPQNTL